jgi:hypothetical protein
MNAWEQKRRRWETYRSKERHRFFNAGERGGEGEPPPPPPPPPHSSGRFNVMDGR